MIENLNGIEVTLDRKKMLADKADFVSNVKKFTIIKK
jgi:hypothetical protein